MYTTGTDDTGTGTAASTAPVIGAPEAAGLDKAPAVAPDAVELDDDATAATVPGVGRAGAMTGAGAVYSTATEDGAGSGTLAAESVEVGSAAPLAGASEAAGLDKAPAVATDAVELKDDAAAATLPGVDPVTAVPAGAERVNQATATAPAKSAGARNDTDDASTQHPLLCPHSR